MTSENISNSNTYLDEDTPADQSDDRLSKRVQAIPSSNIRDSMKKVAKETAAGLVVNLAQGLPEMPAPEYVKQAAIDAINNNQNQYADTWGMLAFREAIAAKYERDYGMRVDPVKEITITCGVSEAVNDALLTVTNPGDEVIIFEPFYENYYANILMANAVPRFVPLHKPDYKFDENELASAFNERTRAIIICNPNNPTTRVFSREELEAVARLCQKWGVMAICDEIYEHMVYDGLRHIPMATLPGMEELTFTCSGLSKTYSLTGWRIGWVIAPERYTMPLRRLHDYLTLACPTPFQLGGIAAVNSPPAFYENLTASYTELRDKLAGYLTDAGFRLAKPQGTYFIFAECDKFGFENDRAFADHLALDIKVVGVSGYSFYRPGSHSQSMRFCFAKKDETLERAGERLKALRAAAV